MILVTDTALALGSFDGIHVAHRSVLSEALTHENPIAVTFQIPPGMVLSGRCELLLSIDKKKELLEKMGFAVEPLDFSSVRETEPEAFLEYLLKKYSPRKICCGFNYHFGKGGKGNVEILSSFCKKHGIELSVTPVVEALGDRVSSSRIRALLKSGNVKDANTLLAREFSLCGTVAHGDERGRTIDFPTVNFPYPESLVELKHGVYAASCEVNGREYPAVCYVGNRPTYKLPAPTVETHLIGFSGDLYGQTLEVKILDFLRDERHFSSLTELKEQLKKDIESIK